MHIDELARWELTSDDRRCQQLISSSYSSALVTGAVTLDAFMCDIDALPPWHNASMCESAHSFRAVPLE